MAKESFQSNLHLSSDDTKAIHKLFEKFNDAWACGDGEAYSSLFCEDAKFIGAPGFRLYDREEIKKEHQEMFDSIFKYSRIDNNYVKEIQQISDDIVFVHSLGNVFFPGKSEQTTMPTGLTTFCLVKRNGIWQIALFQNTPTGSFRHLRFMWNFISSRFKLLNVKWMKEYKQALQHKQSDIDKWKFNVVI